MTKVPSAVSTTSCFPFISSGLMVVLNRATAAGEGLLRGWARRDGTGSTRAIAAPATSALRNQRRLRPLTVERSPLIATSSSRKHAQSWEILTLGRSVAPLRSEPPGAHFQPSSLQPSAFSLQPPALSLEP